MKQSKLRRRRVIRYAILFFVLLAVFIGLIAGPVVAGKQLGSTFLRNLGSRLPMNGQFRLMQPNGQDNRNTNGTTMTGTGRPDYSGALTRTTSASGSRATATSNGRIRLL